MEEWIIYGLLTALLMGIFPVFFKVLANPRYLGVSTQTIAILTWVGSGIVFVGYFLYSGEPLPKNNTAIIVGLLTGVILGLSLLFRIIAIGFGADVAKFVPLYNTNALVAVILGIIILHELPESSEAIRVVVGAIFIIMGGILVSL